MRNRCIAGKITSIVLAITLCATSFTGCGKKKSASEAFEEAKKIDKNCIYKQEELDGILADGDAIDIIGRVGDRTTVIVHAGNGTFKYTSFKPDGSDVQSYDIGGKKEDYIATGTGTFDKEGNAYYLYYEFVDEENSTPFLVKIDPTGKELFRYNLSETFTDEGRFFRCMEWSDKYGLLCGTNEGIQTYDEKNGLKTIIDKKTFHGMGGVDSVIELPDNKLFVSYYDEKSYDGSYVIVNADNKKVEKKLGGFDKDGYYFDYFADDSGNIYAENDFGIHKYNFETDKLEKIFDFRDSSINRDEINVFVGNSAISEKEIIASTTLDDGARDYLVKYTKVNPEDVADKTVITMSTMWADQEIVSQIMKFNRKSDKYVIKIIDYSELCGDDYEEVQKQFNLDLTSGKAADIMCFTNPYSIRKYVDKGILLDLTSAFEQGGPLGDIEILPNIAEMMKYNGKTYTFMPSFEVNTEVVRAEDANGKTSLSYKDCDELIKSKGTDYKTAFGSLVSKAEMCAYLWTYYGNEFIDLKNKKCNFNTPEFAELLNFVNKFPDDVEEVDYVIEDEIESDYAEGKGIFYSAYFRDIWKYAKLKQLVFRGDIEMVGMPNNCGKNMAVIDAVTLAVNSKTEHQDVIYDLIRAMLTEDKSTGFSTVKPKFEEQLQEAAKETLENNPNAEVWDPVNSGTTRLAPLSQEDVKKFYDYTVSIDTLFGYDDEIASIITEESSAFFAGKKTACIFRTNGVTIPLTAE